LHAHIVIAAIAVAVKVTAIAVLANKVATAEVKIFVLAQLDGGDLLLTAPTAELSQLSHRVHAAVAEGVEADALEIRLQPARVRVAEGALHQKEKLSAHARARQHRAHCSETRGEEKMESEFRDPR
jgi:hypothetical protein